MKYQIGLAKIVKLDSKYNLRFIKKYSWKINSRLAAGWYVNSGQRKRYLKSLNYKERSRDLKIRDSKLLNYRIIFRKLFPKVNN